MGALGGTLHGAGDGGPPPPHAPGDEVADAYGLAHPFDRPVPELSGTEQARRMVEEAVALAYRAVSDERLLAIIANNRAWGNAPDLARHVAARFLDFAEEEGA